MKNIRKFLFILSAVGLAVGCSSNVDENSLAVEYQQINASAVQTRTVNDGTSTSWADGDQMSVFHTTTTSGTYGSACFTRTKDDTFSGKVKSIRKDSNDWYSFYPYSEANTNVKAVVMTVPGQQTQTGNNSVTHIAGQVDPLYGVSKDVAYGGKPTLQMHHALVNVKFSIKNAESSGITVKKIEFTSPSSIAGTFKADLTAETLSWAEVSSAKTVELTVSEGTSIAPGDSAFFYAAVLPAGGSGEYAIKVTADCGGKEVVSEKTATADLEFAAGEIFTFRHSFASEGEGGEDPSSVTYYKASDVETGYDYIIVSDGKALANEEGVVTAKSVLVESDKITLEDASSMLWTAVAETSSDLLQYGAYHLTNDGKYLSRISGGGSTSNLEIHASTDDAIKTKMKYTMWDNDAENFWNISIYNSSASTYYAYISSDAWVINTTKPSVKVAFFTTRQPQALAFSGNTAVYDLGTSAYTTAPPTLSGVKTTVSYVSNDPAVATVNASTGEVTPLTKGSTTITATAAGSPEYQAAEASYTLTVIDSKSTDIVLNRATAVKDGGMYVIVNNGKALQNNSGSFGAVTADMDNERTTITFDKNTNLDNLVWTWASSDLDTDYGHYVITNGSDYLYVSGSYPNYTFEVGAYTEGKYAVWDYSNGQVANGKSTSKRYITYDGGWKVPSSASSHDTYLFEYVDPRTPQSLTFAQSTPSIDIASTAIYKQEVSGASTTVTYSISANPSDAATIAADGTVTATKKGTAVITATAAATKDYQGASASYTLTINNSAAVD